MGQAGSSLSKGHLERVSERPSNGNTSQAAPRESLFKQVTLWGEAPDPITAGLAAGRFLFMSSLGCTGADVNTEEARGDLAPFTQSERTFCGGFLRMTAY